jgi:quercetin dioxygenase-like cupin family protein
MPDTVAEIYIAETKARAVFAADGPRPQFLVDTPSFKVLVVGLEAGGQIPLHPGEAAMYHILEGVGLMTVGDETFAIQPGVTVIAPAGAPRGMNAKTRLIFLGAKGE